MQVAEIKLDKWTARDALREYIHHLRDKQPSLADMETMVIYRQLGMGRKVLSLQDAFRTTGIKSDLSGPKLAIARADTARCVFRNNVDWSSDFQQQLCVFEGRRDRGSDTWVDVGKLARKQRSSLQFLVPSRFFPNLRSDLRTSALVPTIPPRFRPSKPEKYHILWEADWQRAPVDPFLLRRIGRDSFVICAQWNLTAVERAVLEIADSW